eukprot:364993-Chlamydomonas_euryale.AAC.9
MASMPHRQGGRPSPAHAWPSIASSPPSCVRCPARPPCRARLRPADASSAPPPDDSRGSVNGEARWGQRDSA